MAIDFRTIFLENSVILLALASFPFLGSFAQLRTQRSFAYWSVAFPFLLLGSVSVATRGIMPLGVSIIASNLFFMCAYLLLLAGALVFRGRSVPLAVFALALAAELALQAVFTFPLPSTAARVAVFGFAGTACDVATAGILLRRRETSKGRADFLAAGFLILLGLASGLRASFALAFGYPDSLFAAPEWDGFIQIVTAGSFVGLALSLLFVHASRLTIELGQAVRDREVLLREMAHRTKNDLAILDGLISLEQGTVSPGAETDRLDSLRARIRCVAAAHDLLSRGDEKLRVRLDSYLSELAALFGAKGRVAIAREFEAMEIDASRAVTLGLAMNELVTNSVKHAFPDGRAGRISLRLRRSGAAAMLEVQDDGVGTTWPPLNPGLGTDLIRSLVARLEGRIAYRGGEGSLWTVTFPVDAPPIDMVERIQGSAGSVEGQR